MNNYFNSMMFNPQYVNPTYYQQLQQIQYKYQQNKHIYEAVKAIHDLCEAVKKMDEHHQQQAFAACLAEMAKEFNW